MKMKRHVFLMLVLIATIHSAFAQDKLKPIPDDFDARNTILLIEDSPDEKKSDMMEDVLQTEYPYKYKIISFKNVRGIRNDTTYAGKPQYRYILANEGRAIANLDTRATFRGYFYEVYYIYDMQEKVTYPSIRAGSFRNDIKALVKHMRKLN